MLSQEHGDQNVHFFPTDNCSVVVEGSPDMRLTDQRISGSNMIGIFCTAQEGSFAEPVGNTFPSNRQAIEPERVTFVRFELLKTIIWPGPPVFEPETQEGSDENREELLNPAS